MLEPTSRTMEDAFRKLIREHSSTMMIVQGLDTPLLPAFRNAARFVLQLDLRRAFALDEPDLTAIRRSAEEAAAWNIKPDPVALNFAAHDAVARAVGRLSESPGNVSRLKNCIGLLDVMNELGIAADYWRAQNVCCDLLQSAYPSLPAESKKFLAALGQRLRLRVEA
jgi:hypothetical protein